jgi:lysozyme
MKLNEDGYKLITDFEGFSSKPYLCSAKIPTIGFGNTYYHDGQRVTLLDKPITKEYALEIFKFIADRFCLAVNKQLKKEVNQNQTNALTSITYNIGIAAFMNSSLLKLVNKNPNDPLIALEFKKWNKVGKKEVAGLTKRRKHEADIYFT